MKKDPRREKDHQRLRDQYDAVDDEDFLTDKQKRAEKRRIKKQMSKLSRKENNQFKKQALDEYLND